MGPGLRRWRSRLPQARRRGEGAMSGPPVSRIFFELAPVIANEGEQTMETKDYTTSFTVDQSPEEVFNAINNVRGWWSEEIEGDTDRLGTEFRFHHKDLHRSTQNITEF